MVFLKPEDVILPTQIYYEADFGSIILRRVEEKFLGMAKLVNQDIKRKRA